jgi:SAM-dependent methyltransferase
VTQAWDALWEGRGVAEAAGSTLEQLMAADGFDSGFAGLTEDSWRDAILALAQRMGIGPSHSVFEVGCGAGALLHVLHERGCAVGGIDRAPALIARAREVLPDGSFTTGDAAALATAPRFDALLSFGVFLYFATPAYAERVLDRMVTKATRVVGVLDLPDAALEAQTEADRAARAGGPRAYAARYAGLEHRYYDRDWFAGALRARGLVDVHVCDQEVAGYGNAAGRFNAWGYVAASS